MQFRTLWIDEAEALESTASLPTETDVAIIGGGVAGVSAALWLARAGASPVLIEADRIASRASGRNDGQLLLGLGEHYNRIVGQFGEQRARDLWDYIRINNTELKRCIADLGIHCEFHQAGGLRLAETEHELTELHEAAELLRAEDIEHELLDVAAVDQELPGSREFHGALRLPGEAIVQPATMVRGLAAAAIREGAQIVEQQPVRAVRAMDGDGYEIVTESGATVRATIVIHCTSTLGRGLDPHGFLEAQVFPFRGQIIATDRLPGDLAAAFPNYAMSSNFCYEYFRVHDGRFVIGGMRWSVPGEEQGTVDDTAANETISQNLLDYAHRHFPALRDVPFPHVWTGIMAGTSDGLPLCGAMPGQPGAFALLGFNGYGLSFAFQAGRTISELVLEGRASHPAAEMFAPRRLS